MTTEAPQPSPAAAPAPAGAPAGAPAFGGPNRGPGRPGGPGGPGGRPGGRPGGGGGRPRGRYAPRRKVCSFCVDHVKNIDYKDVDRIRRFISDRAKIEPRRRSGVCAKHQRALRLAIQRARHLALVPFVPYVPTVGAMRR